MRILLILAASLAFAQSTERVISLRMVDEVIGNGPEAKAGQKYKVHYTGTFPDGKKFDSSRDRNEAFEFVQGRRLVISGWEAGFEGMRVGGKRKLYIPYQMAYGEKGQGAIPPKSDLVFDIELLGVSDVPAMPAGQDVLVLLEAYEKKLLALAEAMPEDKWDFRPKEGVRSFAEVLRHVAFGSEMMASMAGKTPSQEEVLQLFRQHAENVKTAKNKAETVALLREKLGAVKKQLEPMRAGALARDVHFFGMATSVRGIFITLDAHLAEHLGQLIAYARMAGVAPPWSE